MDLRHIIINDYQEAISLLPGIPTELRKGLRTHERVPKFIDNLVREISTLPPQLKPDRLKIKRIVYDITNMFVVNARRHVEEQQMSELAKLAEKKKAQDAQDLAATAEGKPQGEYEELAQENVISGEDKDASLKIGTEA